MGCGVGCSVRDGRVYTGVMPTLMLNVPGLCWLGHRAIPPNRTAYFLQATKQHSYLPPEGVNIWAYILHGHRLATKIWSTITREGDSAEAFGIGCEDEYLFDLQEMVAIQDGVKVLPTDTVHTTCVYDSTSRDSTTYGGLATYEEMCFNFIIFYPALVATGVKDMTNVLHSGDWQGAPHQCPVYTAVPTLEPTLQPTGSPTAKSTSSIDSPNTISSLTITSPAPTTGPANSGEGEQAGGDDDPTVSTSGGTSNLRATVVAVVVGVLVLVLGAFATFVVLWRRRQRGDHFWPVATAKLQQKRTSESSMLPVAKRSVALDYDQSPVVGVGGTRVAVAGGVGSIGADPPTAVNLKSGTAQRTDSVPLQRSMIIESEEI